MELWGRRESMKTKVLIVAVFSAALILIVGAVLLDVGAKSSVPGVGSATGSRTSTGEALSQVPWNESFFDPRSSEPTADMQTSEAPKLATPGSPQGSHSKSGSNAPASPTRPTWNPPDPSTSKALEIQDSSSSSMARLPKSEKRQPVLSKIPRTGTARGKLTPGFPTGAVSAPAAARITMSSVQVQGKQIFVGLKGTTKQSRKIVADHYLRAYKSKGWSQTSTVNLDGSRTLQGGFGDDSIVVSIRTLPTGRTAFTVAGVFVTGE